MTFEASMIGFIIPSQTLESVRRVQIVLNRALLSYSLPAGVNKFQVTPNNQRSAKNIEKRNRNQVGNDGGESEVPFSASKFLHVSHYLARDLSNLPEAGLILEYIDPLPYVEYPPLQPSKSTSLKKEKNTSVIPIYEGYKYDDSDFSNST